ncbi:CGNR zinc finger domain-containing protein [Pseudoroseomonas cervicalis]
MARLPTDPPADPRSFATHPPKPLGGALCLDFVNTLAWRGDAARSSERLHAYAELVHWAAALRLLEPVDAAALLDAAASRPAQAEAARLLALRLRAELAGSFDTARPEGALPEAEALLRQMARIGRLARPGAGLEAVWRPAGAPPDLRLPLLPVAVSALALAVSERRAQVRRCADAQCGWVFLDESRNRTRLWCSMEDCGNRAKARAHYARRRAAG